MATFVLLLVVVYASATDIMTHRIPNWLCGVALISGLLLQVGAVDSPHYVAVIASVGVPFLLLLPFYVGGGMAAGDVKLMASCGALLGWPAALLATGYTLLAGTVLGAGVYVYRCGWRSFSARYGTALRMLYFTGSSFLEPASSDSVARSRFPYALAIALGCLMTFLVPAG